jgi:hypothetical protein
VSSVSHKQTDKTRQEIITRQGTTRQSQRNNKADCLRFSSVHLCCASLFSGLLAAGQELGRMRLAANEYRSLPNAFGPVPNPQPTVPQKGAATKERATKEWQRTTRDMERGGALSGFFLVFNF